MTKIHRRALLQHGGLALTGSALAGSALARSIRPAPAVVTPSRIQAADGGAYADALAAFPATDPALSSEVVLSAHANLDRVVELVTARPHLARATWNWGFGDWESALGAASHMGRRDIAEFLLGHGARPDIFSAAMLGQLGAVRGFVEASPGIQGTPGPHGISLLAHARAGGDASAAVVEYLERVGGADVSPDTVEMSDDQRARFLGTYAFGDGETDALLVEERRGTLTLKRRGHAFGRMLFPVSDREFYPSGSPTVRIAFTIGDGPATAVEIVDHELLVTATRMAS